ncbi:uncharacterized protein RB166_005664 [Leptodactylus fuscus]|uniref:uncharacterized protein LOC142196643 n=1 Tax=Leptodactylus fuscus TaxID=238119 RepID=UPI003F4F3D00
MSRLCERCAQLLQDFVNCVRRLSAAIMEHLKECLSALSECCCLNRRRSRVRQLYEPVLLSHERKAAQEFLKHMETGIHKSLVGKESLHAMTVLAFSEVADFQESAAMYYVFLNQNLHTQLPPEFLEPYHPLLQSSDTVVQQVASSSLLHFLLEGNVSKELIVQVGLLEDILEMMESGDPVVQYNSCSCIMTLAISESNREAIRNARGIVPLLALAKSYEPRVQQSAVGAILNLTRSEKIRGILCQEGALPVLTLLLQSADSEIQYYSCASLSNIAANQEHHKAMLAIGDKFLLRMLVSLMSSSVQKVSSQACLCLNNMASSAEVRVDLLHMDIMPLVLFLLNSSNKEVRQASITLLCTMSHSPGNLDALLCEELLQHLAMLMRMDRANPVVVIHATCTIQNLSRPETIEIIVGSQCFEELLRSLLDPNKEEESLQYVATCLAELAKSDFTRKQLIKRKDEALMRCLVRLAARLEHRELSFQAATIIKYLSHTGRIAVDLKPFMKDVQAYLMNFLSHPELRFQQMGIATLRSLCEDPEFSEAITHGRLKEQLEQVRQQTEETQALLRTVISQTDSLNLKE